MVCSLLVLFWQVLAMMCGQLIQEVQNILETTLLWILIQNLLFGISPFKKWDILICLQLLLTLKIKQIFKRYHILAILKVPHSFLCLSLEIKLIKKILKALQNQINCVAQSTNLLHWHQRYFLIKIIEHIFIFYKKILTFRKRQLI